MFILNISNFAEGKSHLKLSRKPQEIGLTKSDGFEKNVSVEIKINKVLNNFYLQVSLHAFAQLECDRCLVQYEQPLEETFEVIITSDNSLIKDDQDDIYKIDSNSQEVDITESIVQNMFTAIPVKKLCSNECKGLCPKCGSDLNSNHCSCDTEIIDPRWEPLKKLKDN